MTASIGTTALGPERVRRARIGTATAFIVAGFAIASWATRIPQIRDRLDLRPSELGLVLLAIAVGSITALPLSGWVIGHFGSQRTVQVMSVVAAFGLVVTGVGYLVGVIPLAIGLFVFGFANGAWDVAMNVQGALVEQHLGRSIMSRFHAGFSMGTVAGALVGASMVALDVSVTAHLLAVAVLVGVSVPAGARWFVPDHGTRPIASASEDPPRSKLSDALTAWTEPRTLLIGVVVLVFAFSEGAGIDWISVALIDSYGVAPAIGTLAFAGFLAAMTTLRWFGTSLLDRFGRVPVVRALAVLGIVGVLLFVYGGSTPVAFVGVLLWGAGASLGFPVGMSAGADDPARAAPRVSVIASIGYCAFLAGPPLIGFVGDQVTVLRALAIVAALFALVILVTGALRPLPLPPSRS